MAKQTGMSADTLLRVMSFFISCAGMYKKVKTVFNNPIIYYGTIILIISLLLKWFGFTKDYLFMMPLRKDFFKKDDDDE